MHAYTSDVTKCCKAIPGIADTSLSESLVMSWH